MCGLNGIVTNNQTKIQNRIFKKLTNSLNHRGPDDVGFYLKSNIKIGHTRLAIRDLSNKGRQPFLIDNGNIIVAFNGEIYNYEELKTNLEKNYKIKFHSTTDTEIIPYGYKIWGKKFFSMMNGMYAISLWDNKKKLLYLIRDVAGIKPLYYHVNSQFISFGSEIKSLYFKENPQINTYQAKTFLHLGYTSPNKTLLKNVLQVNPGTFLTINSKLKIKYNKIVKQNKQKNKDFSKIWKSVIKSQLKMDTPYAVLQSGGIDSTIVTSEIYKNHQKKINLINIQSKDSNKFEFDNAKNLSRQYKLKLKEIKFNPKKIEKIFKKIVTAVDGQLSDPSLLALYELMANVPKNIKVCISGDGADELFGGYITFKSSILAKYIRYILPNFFLKIIALLDLFSSNKKEHLTLFEKISRFADGLIYSKKKFHSKWRSHLKKSISKKILGDEFKKIQNYDPFNDYDKSSTKQINTLDYYMDSDFRYYLPSDCLQKVDRMSMLFGIEVRVPFLDDRVINFSRLKKINEFSILFKNKPFLRNFLKKYNISKEIINSKKSGLSMPIYSYLRNDLKKYSKKLLFKNSKDLNKWIKIDYLKKNMV